MPALLNRFEKTTLGKWAQHGIRQVGFWTVEIGETVVTSATPGGSCAQQKILYELLIDKFCMGRLGGKFSHLFGWNYMATTLRALSAQLRRAPSPPRASVS